MNEAVSVRLLLAAIVVSGVTTFMFYPLITLELLRRGENAVGVGIILGLLSGVGPLASSMIGRGNAERGSRAFAVGGLILRSIGIAALATNAGVVTYAAGAVLASIGSSATALAIKTELMRASPSRHTITLRSMMVNIGAVVGPSIGGILFLRTGFSTIVVIAILAYTVLAIALTAVDFHPPENTALRPVPILMRGTHQTSYQLLSVCVFGYWAIYALWPLVVPVIAAKGFGTPAASAWVYTGNAILILALQYAVLVKGLARVRSTQILGLGFACFFGCFAVVALPPGPAMVVAFATLFSVAELLVSPTLDEITGRLHVDGFGLTRAYGKTATISGIASLIGAPVGGMLIERSGSFGGVLWLGAPMAIIGLAAARAMGRLEPTL